MIGVATRRFQPTNRTAEKRTHRVVTLFSSAEYEWLQAEAARRNLTIHNLLRLSLELLQAPPAPKK